MVGLPRTLLLILRRPIFTHDAQGGVHYRKNPLLVIFPEFLDCSNIDMTLPVGAASYALHAVVNHDGNNILSGKVVVLL